MLDTVLRKRINDWLRRQAYVDTDEKGICVKVLVCQASGSGKQGAEIGVVKMPKKPLAEDFGVMTQEIGVIATNDAEGLGGVQRYLLVAMHKNDDGFAVGERHTFRIVGVTEDEDEGMSEAPTKTGLVNQQMRHNEALMKIATMQSTHIISQQALTIQRLTAQLESMQQKHFDTVELMEDLMSKKHERELTAKTQGNKLELQREMANKLMLLAPTIVNAAAKKRLMKENTTPIEQLLHSLFVSFKPEQFNGLMESEMFTPDQKMGFMALVESVMKFDPKREDDGESKKNGAAS
jgi:hypothetical protein